MSKVIRRWASSEPPKGFRTINGVQESDILARPAGEFCDHLKQVTFVRSVAQWILYATLVLTAVSPGCGKRSSRGEARSDELAVVRRELAARYAENEAGFFARDPDRVMLLRHPEFHTITPDGTVSTREQMYERTRAFIARIERFDSLSEDITALTLKGDTAHAIVLQRTVRQQRLDDGMLHDVRTSVVQRESWIRTKAGWLFWRVDQIQPGETLVDGRPVQ